MPGCCVSRHCNVSEPHGIAIADGPIDLHRWKLELHGLFLARIIATLEERPVARPGNQLRARFLLEFSKSARMVEMGMGIEHIFDVGDLEPELCNAALDLRCRIRKPSVD